MTEVTTLPITELRELQQQADEIAEKIKELRKTIEEKVLETEGMKLSGEWGEAKMVYVPRWKYSKELTEKEAMTLDRLKLLKKEEQTTGKAEKVADGGRLVIKLNK